MDPGKLTQDTLDQLKKAAPQDPSVLGKAYNQALGLVWYDLEPTAKLLYPVITPLRNMIPRVSGNGGTATNWKSITAINTGKMSAGVGEGNRSGAISVTAANCAASYKGLGMEDWVSFEADYAAQNFDDVKALAVLNLLRAVMIAEEQIILLGDGSFQLNAGNATPTPTAATSNNTGTLTANTVYFGRCLALTPQGYQLANMANGVVATTVRTNVDGTNDTINGGCGIISAANNANASNKTSIDFAGVAVKGAAGYAWYCGTNQNSANLVAITTVPKYCYLGNETVANQTANAFVGNATDRSNDALIFDGLWTQICTANSGAYFADLGGNALNVANGSASCNEIDTALRSFWDNYRLSPDTMIVAAQEVNNLNRKILSGNGAPLFRFNMDAGGQETYTAGRLIGNYLNKFSMDGGQLVKVMLHPNQPPGAIMFYSSKVPYPLSNVQNILQVKTRRDYYQIEWPLKRRAYEYGVYVDELLQNYFPPAFGLITGIADA